MRQIVELQPGDHVEHMGFSWVIKDVEVIPEGDPADSSAFSPFVAAHDVYLTTDTFERQLTPGRLDVVITGCDGCGEKHKPENCRRRSL